MKDQVFLLIIFSMTILGAMSIVFSFLLLVETPNETLKSNDIKEVMINGELYRQVEKGE